MNEKQVNPVWPVLTHTKKWPHFNTLPTYPVPSCHDLEAELEVLDFDNL